METSSLLSCSQLPSHPALNLLPPQFIPYHPTHIYHYSSPLSTNRSTPSVSVNTAVELPSHFLSVVENQLAVKEAEPTPELLEEMDRLNEWANVHQRESMTASLEEFRQEWREELRAKGNKASVVEDEGIKHLGTKEEWKEFMRALGASFSLFGVDVGI